MKEASPAKTPAVVSQVSVKPSSKKQTPYSQKGGSAGKAQLGFSDDLNDEDNQEG